MAILQKYEFPEESKMKKIVLVVLMLTVLTGWNLDESLKEIGEGIRTGVSNAEEGTKEAPGAISEAGNQAEDDIKKKDTEDKEDN
jgi:ribosomal protein L12E/L44/L45/RPP1/RPP2